jgi:hypothetical protein
LEILLAIFLWVVFLKDRFDLTEKILENFLCVERECIRPAKYLISLGFYIPASEPGGRGPPRLKLCKETFLRSKLCKAF